MLISLQAYKQERKMQIGGGGGGGGGMEGGQNVEENEKGLGGWRWGVHEEQEESAKQ